MFAVPGWSVSADLLKTQTKPLPSEAANGSPQQAKSRKRKRGKNKAGNEPNVNAENIDQAWVSHIENVDKKDSRETRDVPAKSTKKSKKRKDRNQDGSPQDPPLQQNGHRSQESQNASSEATQASVAQQAPRPNPKLTPLQASMQQKLISSRFRHLNETLYTTSSSSSLKMFSQNPQYFDEYHEGFRRQVMAWPENPVDGFIRWVRERGKIRPKREHHSKFGTSKNKESNEEAFDSPSEQPLPRNFRTGLCTIIDLGCGDAELAKTLTDASGKSSDARKLKLKVESFDLAAKSPLVTAADIRALPLPESTADVAIFCLALMGTNWIDFIEEAYRVLRWKGECWISEVHSRFPAAKAGRVLHSVGNRVKTTQQPKKKGKAAKEDEDEEQEDYRTVEEETVASKPSTDLSAFIAVLRRRGFALADEPELGNKMFVRMRFIKCLIPTRGKGIDAARESGAAYKGRKKFIQADHEAEMSLEEEAKVLKPCVYKNR